MRLPDIVHVHLGPLYLQWGHRSEHDNTPASGGLGFLGALTLLFVGLKLGGLIDWAWWWALAPLLAPVAVIVALALLAGIIFCGLVLYFLVQDWRSERRAHRAG